jgi:hypothetical protein
VQRAIREPLGQQEAREQLVIQELLGARGQREVLEQQETQAQQEILVQRAVMVQRVILAQQEALVLQAILVQLVIQELRVLQEIPEPQAIPVQPELKAFKGIQALLVTRVLQELLGQPF